MVSDILSQIDNSFQNLIDILSAESDVNGQVSRFLSYVKEKHAFVRSESSAGLIKESIRGINRYSDEFEFTAVHSKEIRDNLNLLFDLANRL